MNSFVEDLGRFQTANEKMLAVVAEARRVAPTVNPVMILGEEGSGRRELALEIFEKSGRSQNRLVRWTQENMEYCELYSTDTVLLENIDTFTPEQQLALCARVSRTMGQSMMRGPRWISTGSRDLNMKVRREEFSLKLFQMLSIQSLFVPSLNERAEDIVDLARGFVGNLNLITGNLKVLSVEAIQKIQRLKFSKNVQELNEMIQKAYSNSKTETIEPNDFDSLNTSEILSLASGVVAGVTLSEMEKRLIIQTLEMTKQNRTRAAEILGISIRTLRNKLQEYREEPGL